MKIAVVTDSTAYLSKEAVRKYNIKVISLPIIIDGKVYDEGIDITEEEFYSKLKTAKTFPSTSQPSIGNLMSVYKNLAKQGYQCVISIHLASTISGLYKTLESLTKEIPEIKVVPFDSKLTVSLMGQLAIEASKMAKNGQDVSAIIERLKELRKTFGEYFIVDDLKNLVRGGRLSNASAFIGSVLRIKPILTFDDETDKIVAFDKARSTKKALKKVEDLFEKQTKNLNYPLKVFVIHANDIEAAINWKKTLSEKFPKYKFELSYFGPVIGTHLGEKALALCWMEDIDSQERKVIS